MLLGATGPNFPAVASPLWSYLLFREQGANSSKCHTLRDPSIETTAGQKQERLLLSWHQTKDWLLNIVFSFLFSSDEGAGAISERNEAGPCEDCIVC